MADKFENQVDVTVRRRKMKKTEDKGGIIKNPPNTMKKLLFADIHHYNSPLSDLGMRLKSLA